MSNTGERVRSITIDPANSDKNREVDPHETTTTAPSRDGDEYLGVDEFLIPTSGPSKEEILDKDRRDVTPLVNDVIRKLLPLQLRCGFQTRLHLVVEKDVDDTVMKWAEEGSSGITSCSRIECRILFSPTLRYDSPETKKMSETMTKHLSAASFSAMKTVVARSNASLTQTNEPTPPDSNHMGREQDTSLDVTSFEGWDTFVVPEWFPFKQDVYKTGPQVSDSELLEIPGNFVHKFQRLSKDGLEKIWSQFFRTLHDGVRRKARKHKRMPFKYTWYTPPWLRKQIKVGTQIHRIGQVTIRSVRSQRSDWGYRTMALILAGYFHKEVFFGKPILMQLLDSLFKGRLGRNRRISNRDFTSPRPRKVRLNDTGQATNSTPGDTEARGTTEVVSLETNHDHQNDVGNEIDNRGEVATRKPETEQQEVRQEVDFVSAEQIMERRVESTNDQGGTDVSHEHAIVCAAKKACRFRDDPEAQNPSGMTAKCSVCKRPVHDLCGGGESDIKRCPGCSS